MASLFYKTFPNFCSNSVIKLNLKKYFIKLIDQVMQALTILHLGPIHARTMNCLLGKAWHRPGRNLNFRNLKKERTADCHGFNKISITTVMYLICSFRMSKLCSTQDILPKKIHIFSNLSFLKLIPNGKKQVFFLCSGHGTCFD